MIQSTEFDHVLAQYSQHFTNMTVCLQPTCHFLGGARSADITVHQHFQPSKQPKITFDGWEILIEWKDGSTSWVRIKDVKDNNPIEMADAVANKIHKEPALK